MITPKQQRFVEEYLKDHNATQAAIRAGYAAKHADVTGPRLLGYVGIQNAIAECGKEIAAQCKADSACVLERAVRCFETSIADFLTFPADGSEPYFDLRKATPEKLACVDSLQLDEQVTTTEDGERVINRKMRLTLPKRREMLETIGKHVAVQAFKELGTGSTGTAPVNLEINIVGVEPKGVAPAGDASRFTRLPASPQVEMINAVRQDGVSSDLGDVTEGEE